MKTFFIGYFLGAVSAILVWFFRKLIAQKTAEEIAAFENKINPPK